MRSMILATIATFALAFTVNAAPCRDAAGKFIKCPAVVVKTLNCKVGKACGKSCIAKDKVCHIPG